jgi:DNA-binding response OmpR family regulator
VVDQRLIRKSILCIDDDASCLEVHKRLLERAGYEVFDCANGDEGPAVYSSVQLDLVLLDYSMPGMNGAEVACAMRALRPGVPIMMVSGQPDRPEDSNGCVDAYLDKTQGFEEILAKIVELLGKTASPAQRPGNGCNCGPGSQRPFSGLQGRALVDFEKMGLIVSRERGAQIFVQGEIPLSIFVLCSGRAALTSTTREGETSSLRIARAGHVLGLSAALNGSAYAMTAEVLENCRVRIIRVKEFMRFLEKYPEASKEAARCILEDYRLTLNDIQRLALADPAAGPEWS